MLNTKKVFGLLGLSIASMGILCGVTLASSASHNNLQIVSKADTEASITNSVPDYFSAKVYNNSNERKDLISSNSYLILASSNDVINFKFLTKEIIDTTNGNFYAYDKKENSWTAFSFSNFSIKRNGTTLNPIIPTGVTTNYVKKQAREQAFDQGVFTYSFDLNLKLDKNSENCTFEEPTNPETSTNTLILNQEGIYEISIPYTKFQTNSNGENFFVTDNDTLTFKFMLFDENTYHLPGTTSPIVEVSNDLIQRTIDRSDREYKYYFYNYSSTDLPYIAYDVNKYNLTISRNYNLAEESVSLVYDNSNPSSFTKTYSQSDLFDLKLDGSTAYIYFSDLGDYTLDFDLVYKLQNGDNYDVYSFPADEDVTDQKLYMFGYQSTYTKLDTSTNKNTYPEFKYIQDESIAEAADISRLVSNASYGTSQEFNSLNEIKASTILNSITLTKEVKPVRTNQVPVKFKEYAKIASNGKLYKLTNSITAATGNINLENITPSDITSSKNISEAGTYVAIFTYTFDDFIDPQGLSASTQQFTQIFLFEVDNQTPSVEVYEFKEEPSTIDDNTVQLPSGAYTNKDVYIKNVYEESLFNSDVNIKVECYDFVNKAQRATKKLTDYDKVEINNKELYKVTENGNYTIKIYYGRNSENPIVRRFNIDKTAISNIEAFAVNSISGVSYYSMSSNIEKITNQPLVFSWEDTKASGAKTYGYYRFYPIEQTTTYSSMSSSTLSGILTSFTNNNAVPVDYELKLGDNASWIYYPNANSVVNSSVIPASYVRSASGLYVLDVFDDAGNKTTNIYLIDTTSPNFIINEPSKDGTDNYSILTKSTTLSRDATIYWGKNKVIKTNSIPTDFYNDKNGNENTIENAWNSFNDQTNYYTDINYLSTGNGKYIFIPINEKIYFKDIGTSGYTSKEESKHDIVSSFKLFYTTDGTNFEYYFSTTIDNVYVKIDNPRVALSSNTEATKARMNGELVSVYSNIFEYTSNPDGKNYDSIYNMEGTYTFLIRDQSNTKFSTNETQTYLNYPSSFQTIQLTSDASLLQVGYKDNSEFTSLTKSADYAGYETKQDDLKTRYIFYEPVNYDGKLYISFNPRVVDGDKITQVKEVTVEYYPFLTNVASSYSSKYSSSKLDFHRDIASNPASTHRIYSFTGNESTDKLEFELQIVNEKTAEGMYVIKRVYMNDEGYFINDYDYYERVLTLIVDRENTISEPEVVEAKMTEYKYSYTLGTATLQAVASTLFSDVSLKNNPRAVVILENGDEINLNNNSVSESIKDEKYIYQFDSNIKSVKFYIYNQDKDNFEEKECDYSITKPIQTTQSVTGNGIFVSVFTGDSESVEFPNYGTSDSIALSTGYTFYTTKQSFTNLENLATTSPVLTTNKIPFMIYVPSIKYTCSSSTNDYKNYTAKENENLTYFKGTDKAIESYQLHALVFKDNIKIAESAGSENGYLIFKDLKGNIIESFTEAGYYGVVVVQGYNDIAPAQKGYNESFKNSYTFSFNVEKSSPEFELYSEGGKQLKSDGNIYYTNSNKVITTWTDSASEYMVNIDTSKIILTSNDLVGSYVLDVSDPENITCKNIEDDTITLDSSAFTFEKQGVSNRLEIDLKTLKLNSNRKSLTITMSYVHPENLNYYQSTSKTINIDTTIYDISGTATNVVYSNTLTDLFAKIGNIDGTLTLDSIRNYYTNEGLTTQNPLQTSYSSSTSNGFYRNYSYPVDREFFEGLLEKANNNITSNKTGVTSIYFRQDLGNIYDSNENFEETNYKNFFETNTTTFINLTDVSINSLEKGNYYEIIETDYAGNLLIYIVYYKDSSNEAIKFNDKELKVISDSEVKSNMYNICGSTSLKIEDIALSNDKWNFVQIQNNGITTRYVCSPYLSKSNMIRNLSTGEDVDIGKILNNTSTIKKSLLLITDRSQNSTYSVYVNRSNTANIQAEKLSSGVGIRIALPSGNIVTDNLIRSFPVSISIKTKNPTDPDYTDLATYENYPNKNLDPNYSYQNAWTRSDTVVNISYSSESGYLVLTFANEQEKNKKIKYTIIDNFGKETSLIQIVGSDFTDAEQYTGNLYKTYDESGELYNRTQDSYSYIYNPQVYKVHVYKDGTLIKISEYTDNNITYITGENNTLTFKTQEQIDEKYELKVYDAEETEVVDDYAPETIEPVKSIYVHLYKLLPTLEGNINKIYFIDENANSLAERFNATGSITINQKTYAYTLATTFASIVNVRYEAFDYQFPYKGYIYKEGESEEFVEFDKKLRIEESGIYYILLKYDSQDAFTNEYVMYRIEILDSSTTFFYVTVDGHIVNMQNRYYTSLNQKQYSNYYIVNVQYSKESSRVAIETNQYQKVRVINDPPASPIIDNYSSEVTTVIYELTNMEQEGYPVGVSPYHDYVAISYIPKKSKPAQEISYIKAGDSYSLIDASNVMVAADKNDESTLDSLKIRWSAYYGLNENKISISAKKDGYDYNLPTYTEDNYYYTILNISGTYRLTFKDSSGNIQTFGNRDYLDLIFLKDVHFTMIYKDENNQTVESEAIDKGVFNNTLSLKIKNISSYYTSSSVGTGSNIINVKRNGSTYTGYSYDANTTTFTFNEVGFYQIYFTATTTNSTQLREQTYSFTIINPNESRFAYEFAPYQGYTIEKIIIDNGVNVVEKTNLSGDDLYSLYVNKDKDGSAKWTVTINTNKVLTPGSNKSTKFTFSFLIRSEIPPIVVSISEGSTSTKPISVTFNTENIYNSVGDCVLTIADRTYDINSETVANLGTVSLNITEAGTYYVQVHTKSGNLLYSYKVIKKDPLNAWAIAAIAIGSVVLVVVFIIVFRLRKRVRSK